MEVDKKVMAELVTLVAEQVLKPVNDAITANRVKTERATAPVEKAVAESLKHMQAADSRLRGYLKDTISGILDDKLATLKTEIVTEVKGAFVEVSQAKSADEGEENVGADVMVGMLKAAVIEEVTKAIVPEITKALAAIDKKIDAIAKAAKK